MFGCFDVKTTAFTNWSHILSLSSTIVLGESTTQDILAHNNYCRKEEDLKFQAIIGPDFFPVISSNMSVRAGREAEHHTVCLYSSATEWDRRTTYHFTCLCGGGRSNRQRVEMSAVASNLLGLTVNRQSGCWVMSGSVSTRNYFQA